MPVLKVFGGVNGYKDESAIRDLIQYPFQAEKGYMGDYDSRNLIETGDIQGMVDQFTFVSRINTRVQIKMDHFVISVSGIMYDTQMIGQIKSIVLNHFGKGSVDGSYFQIFCAEHFLMDDDNLHFHFIMNHVSTSGKVFYGRDQDYGALLRKLRESTGLKWTFMWADSSDYD